MISDERIHEILQQYKFAVDGESIGRSREAINQALKEERELIADWLASQRYTTARDLAQQLREKP